MRECGAEVPPSPLAASGLAYDAGGAYLDAIRAALDAASGALLRLMLGQGQLMGWLRSIKHFFLLDQVGRPRLHSDRGVWQARRLGKTGHAARRGVKPPYVETPLQRCRTDAACARFLRPPVPTAGRPFGAPAGGRLRGALQARLRGQPPPAPQPAGARRAHQQRRVRPAAGQPAVHL
jgi:hypothetical protein